MLDSSIYEISRDKLSLLVSLRCLIKPWMITLTKYSYKWNNGYRRSVLKYRSLVGIPIAND